MRSPEPAVTVVIPTRGLRERAVHLWRAIESVRDQQGVRAVPLVVLNGAQCAPDVESALRSAPWLRLIVRDAADLPAAHRAGRDAVDTPWFGTLDDDDVLLPGGLARRVRALEERPAADVIVTNGILRVGGHDRLHIAKEANVARDPLRALLRGNWLLPGSWLARTERVGASIYHGMPRYRECTFLALRFCTEYSMLWLQEPTIVYHLGSPRAESGSREYALGQVGALEALLELRLPAWMRRRLRWEIAGAFHGGADRLWSEGRLDEAWRMHGRSLRAWGGMRYVAFTRHLLAATWRRAIARAGWAAE